MASCIFPDHWRRPVNVGCSCPELDLLDLTISVMQELVDRRIEIITPTSKTEIADGRELHYEYIEQVGGQPLLRPYFEAQNFAADIDQMPRGYEAPDGVYLVAYVNGVPAGTVAVRRIDETTCEMKRLYVRRAFQGFGLGRMLAEKAIAESKKLGYSRMRLDNSKSVMTKANALYTSLGFYEIEPYNRNFVVDAYFMEKILS